jgi:hypothetical protein
LGRGRNYVNSEQLTVNGGLGFHRLFTVYRLPFMLLRALGCG